MITRIKIGVMLGAAISLPVVATYTKMLAVDAAHADDPDFVCVMASAGVSGSSSMSGSMIVVQNTILDVDREVTPSPASVATAPKPPKD